VAETSFDAISLLICIRVISQSLEVLQKRNIPALDTFLNEINLLLWPRFQTVIDMHIESVKKVPTFKPGEKERDTHPHFIMRRYAEFAVSILVLNQGYDDMLLVNRCVQVYLISSLSRLRTEVESLIYRMACEYTEKKTRTVFLINNYDLVCSIIAVRYYRVDIRKIT
jgi:hypothetical protein